MPKTDHPLKYLAQAFVTDIAAWVLGQPVTAAAPLPTELLPGQDPLRADQLFQVTLADARKALFHIEFQGPGSREPMPRRMLEYMTRMSGPGPDFLMYNVVMYVGQGMGKEDPGVHHLTRPDGDVALTWRYRVIRLWELEAEALLVTGRPALLALVGQTRMAHPEIVLPQVVATFKALPDPTQQQTLLHVLVALITDEEVLRMLETLLDAEDLGLDTALRRIRRREREEGREEGRAEGVRATLLDVVQVRFVPPDATLAQVATRLAAVQDEATLRTLFHAALQAADLDTWLAALDALPTTDR